MCFFTQKTQRQTKQCHSPQFLLGPLPALLFLKEKGLILLGSLTWPLRKKNTSQKESSHLPKILLFRGEPCETSGAYLVLRGNRFVASVRINEESVRLLVSCTKPQFWATFAGYFTKKKSHHWNLSGLS